MKIDKKLGYEVRNCLVEKGVETPFFDNGKGEDEKYDLISHNFKNIMEELGLDLSDDSLCETPNRVAKMFVYEIFKGLNYENFPKMTTIENKMNYDNLVIVKAIKVSSFCEHHFVNITGQAHIAYKPRRKVIGLSKFNRVVDFFSRRPQVQERLTNQIYYALSYILDTEDIAVVIKADHLCVKARGVEDINSETITSKVGGIFINNDRSRKEFLDLIKNNY